MYKRQLVNYLEKKNIKRVYASLLLLAGILVFISLIFVNIIPRIGNDLSVFVLEIPNIFNFIENFVHEIRAGESNILPSYFSNLIDIDQEIQRLSTILRNSFSNLSTALIQTTGKLLDIILTPIITFYYLKDKEKLLASASKLLQRDGFKILSDILKDIDRVLGGFIKGQLIVATFIGILTGVGAAVLGVPYSVTIGLVAGVTNIIPVSYTHLDVYKRQLPMMAGKIPPSEPKINPWGELNKNSLLILPRPRDIV